MNAPYPAARVIALYTLLAPVLFGFGVGLPLGVLMLPVVLASLLYGWLTALACGIWLAVWRTRHARGAAARGGFVHGGGSGGDAVAG